jgi:hypothetical protein
MSSHAGFAGLALWIVVALAIAAAIVWWESGTDESPTPTSL